MLIKVSLSLSLSLSLTHIAWMVCSMCLYLISSSHSLFSSSLLNLSDILHWFRLAFTRRSLSLDSRKREKELKEFGCFEKLKQDLFVYDAPMILLSTSLNVANVPCSFSLCSIDKTGKKQPLSSCISYCKYTNTCVVSYNWSWDQ